MPPKTSVLFTFRLIPAISRMLARRGIDAAELLARAGLPLDAMRGEVTAPLHRVQHFITLAADALGTEHFGLDLAAALPGGVYGVAEFLVRSAPTVDDAARTLCEFASVAPSMVPEPATPQTIGLRRFPGSIFSSKSFEPCRSA